MTRAFLRAAAVTLAAPRSWPPLLSSRSRRRRRFSSRGSIARARRPGSARCRRAPSRRGSRRTDAASPSTPSTGRSGSRIWTTWPRPGGSPPDASRCGRPTAAACSLPDRRASSSFGRHQMGAGRQNSSPRPRARPSRGPRPLVSSATSRSPAPPTTTCGRSRPTTARSGRCSPHPTTAQMSSRFSPDGKWLAYQSNETGRYEVYVEPFPRTGARTQISDGGGERPVWSPDGREIFFDREATLFVAAVERRHHVHRAHARRAADQRIHAGVRTTVVGSRAGRVALPRDVSVRGAANRGTPRCKAGLPSTRGRSAAGTALNPLITCTYTAALLRRACCTNGVRTDVVPVVEPERTLAHRHPQCGTLRRTHHDQTWYSARGHAGADCSRSPSPHASWPATACRKYRRRASAAGGRASPARISSTPRKATTRRRSPIR